jgi:hypothetical protein
VRLQSVNKIEFGNCRPVLHAFSIITNIWQPSCNSFSDKQLELMACDRSFPPVGPIWGFTPSQTDEFPFFHAHSGSEDTAK